MGRAGGGPGFKSLTPLRFQLGKPHAGKAQGADHKKHVSGHAAAPHQKMAGVRRLAPDGDGNVQALAA